MRESSYLETIAVDVWPPFSPCLPNLACHLSGKPLFSHIFSHLVYSLLFLLLSLSDQKYVDIIFSGCLCDRGALDELSSSFVYGLAGMQLSSLISSLIAKSSSCLVLLILVATTILSD